MKTKKVIEPVSASPVPVKQKVETMDFPAAMRAVIDGKRVKRLEWKEEGVCAFLDNYLIIYRNGKNNQWIVNDGDMLATDWVMV